MDHDHLLRQAVNLHGQGHLQKAADLYRLALAARPDSGETALFLGLCLHSLDRHAEAEAALAKAADLLPGDPGPLNGLGAVLLHLGQVDKARLTYLKALKLPDADAASRAETLDGLGNTFQAQGRFTEAVAQYEKALELQPDSPVILSNLGAALKSNGRPDQAVARYHEALQLAPSDTDTLYNLGNAAQALGDMDLARESYGRAAALAPEAVAPRWGLTFAHIPMLFRREEEIDPARKAYGDALAGLELYLESGDRMARAASVAGNNQPFYLAYHGRNDRESQARYGRLMHRVMAARFPALAARPPKRKRSPGGRIRVGVLTGYMHEHSVWKIPTRGWLEQLDREKFEVFGYYTGVKEDACTMAARAACDHFVHQPHDFPAMVRAVRGHNLDVLLFPEVGMDPATAKAAALGLAPVQAVSLGHPMTTGLPTMDHFLTSDLMEPEGGEEYYTESLVRLPNTGVWHEPTGHEPAPLTRADFGLPEDEVLFFCPQSLFKYLPQYDRLFPLVAGGVGKCRFVFLRSGPARVLNERFEARVRACFKDHGLDQDDHFILLDRQPPDRFLALNRLCDVFLDSLAWSGFNTAVEASSTGLPVLTCPTGPMRGRHSLAVVRMLGNHEAVAGNFDEYVQLAVRAGTDKDFRNKLRERTVKNRDRLYRDREAIRGLEEYLVRAAGE